MVNMGLGWTVLFSILISTVISYKDESSRNNDARPGELSEKKCMEYHPIPQFNHLPVVAGGSKTSEKEFPHMAAVGFGEKDDIQWECGGSLISKRFVLTAAHCITSSEGEPKFVRLGDLDLSVDTDDAFSQDFNISRIIVHPSYDQPAKYHDLALLELDREPGFNKYVSPACLHTEERIPVEAPLVATGWGRTGFIEDASSFLLQVGLDYVPHSKCVQAFGRYSEKDLPRGILDTFQICAGTVKGKDTCQGDSGGPLQYKKHLLSHKINVHNIVGVTSFGKACALSRTPGIYTRVSHYLPWIEGIIWENEEQSSSVHNTFNWN